MHLNNSTMPAYGYLGNCINNIHVFSKIQKQTQLLNLSVWIIINILPTTYMQLEVGKKEKVNELQLQLFLFAEC